VKKHTALTNLCRQLELPYTDYHFSTKKEAIFAVKLEINLASHARARLNHSCQKKEVPLAQDS
jgi:hypothetical protein